jgi:hypothetical protein
MKLKQLSGFLVFSLIIVNLLSTSSASQAASTNLIPVKSLPTSYDYKALQSALTVSFDLPDEISPSQGATASWGAIPQFKNAQGDSAIIDDLGREQPWNLSIQNTGNRATYKIGFRYNGQYKIIFWAQVGSNLHTYTHNIVVTGTSELNQTPNLVTSISYISQKTQAIVSVKDPFPSEGLGCVEVLDRTTYQKLIDQNRPLANFYTRQKLVPDTCQRFNSEREATFSIDMTAYQIANNDLHLVHFFNPGPDGYSARLFGGPPFFRSYPLQLTFTEPRFTPTINCEPLYREKTSKCSLRVNALNALGANVYVEKPVNFNIEIKKSNGVENKLISGKYGVENIFYIGPDSTEQILSIKYGSEPTFVYTIRPYEYSASEKFEIQWKLDCSLNKSVAKCSVSNLSKAKYGFDLPATVPFEVTTRIWKSGETISDSTSFGRAMAPNSKFDFQIPVPKNSQVEEIQIGDGVTPDFANWINADFDRPMTTENSVISLDCPESFKGNSVKCSLEFGTLSNYAKSVQISLEARNTKNGWRSVKKVSVTPDKLVEVTIPSIFDTTLQVRAVAVISGEKLYSETSKWQTSSASSTSSPSLEGAIRNAMLKQCQKLPTGFSKYSVQYSKQTMSSDFVPGFIYIINKKTYIQIYNMGAWYMGPSNAISDRKTWSAWGCGGGIWIY